MFSSFKNLFEQRLAGPADQDNEEERLRLATCALLLEAAHADDDFTAEERATVGQLVGRRYGLSSEQTAELMTLAEQERQHSHDLFQFARLINDHYAHPRKLAIVESLWRVVFSDGVLAAHEDALVHKLGKLLGVRHEELIALKLRVQRRLEDDSD